MKINIKQLLCKRCQHEWTPRQATITICPNCKSPNWQKEKPMTQEQKYEAILEMRSIETNTMREHPTKSAFKTALRDGRVTGDYTSRITIVSNDPRKSYTFEDCQPFKCYNCDWRGEGSGNCGNLIEDDRCPDCGEYL